MKPPILSDKAVEKMSFVLPKKFTKAQAEVAREIFEEIEDHKSCDKWGNTIVTIACNNMGRKEDLEWYQSLKSKYTGGQK